MDVRFAVWRFSHPTAVRQRANRWKTRAEAAGSVGYRSPI
ncbi:hypothetical protein bAD24_p01780 (plasmid) [Burkholderia sp. AD24]|nr:hypothetical protein bAD24_p01780 [Burkholderia sp. AD24]